MNAHTKLASELLPSVLEAGRIIMSHFRNGVDVETKAGGSPVTAADREAEVVLLAALARCAPNVSVIAEEMSEGQTISRAGDRFFLVDPLDGTREFTSGRSEFTVNVGLIENGQPTFGIVYAPALSKLYLTLAADHAATGPLSADADAATVSLDNLGLSRLAVRRFSCDEALTVSASRSHGSAEVEDWLSRIDVSARVNVGSSLKFCQIACGDAHVYPRFGPTMEWDTAAGHAIALAAGGVVTTVDGQDLVYGKYEDGYRNPHFIASACRDDRFYRSR